MAYYRLLAVFISRKLSQLIHSIRKIIQALQRQIFCRASNSGSVGVKKIIIVSLNFEKIAKDKYETVGRGYLLDILRFSQEKKLRI
jgi:hypothetical protein